jgi:uncharacterized protein (TIGR02118 family)
MTITRLGTAPRAAGLSFAGFQDHWRGEHAGLAGELPGLRRYVQNHAVLVGGRPLLPYAGFDACSEIEFDSIDAMDAAFASEHYRSTVTADEHALIDRPRFMLALLERHTLRAGPGDIKLMTFWRATPRSSVAELHATLADAWPDDGQTGHEQLRVIEDAHDGRPGPVCDAVDILRFAAVDAARAFAPDEAEWRLAGIGSCVGRLLATEVVVRQRSSSSML